MRTGGTLVSKSEEKPKASPLAGIILVVLTALLACGILTFAAPCPSPANAQVHVCLWASRAVLGVCAVLAIVSIVRVFETDEGERRGLSLAAALLGALAAVIPGFVIDLCADASMQCNSIMHPFVSCLGAAIFLVGAVDLTVRLLRIRKPAKPRG